MQFEFVVLAANQLNLKPSFLFFLHSIRFDWLENNKKWWNKQLLHYSLRLCVFASSAKKVYFIINTRSSEAILLRKSSHKQSRAKNGNDCISNACSRHFADAWNITQHQWQNVYTKCICVYFISLFIWWTTCLLIKMEYHKNGIKAAITSATNWSRVYLCALSLFPHISLALESVGRVGSSFNLVV